MCQARKPDLRIALQSFAQGAYAPAQGSPFLTQRSLKAARAGDLAPRSRVDLAPISLPAVTTEEAPLEISAQKAQLIRSSDGGGLKETGMQTS